MLKRFIFTKFALRANFILALCITGCASPEYRDSVIGKPADFQKVEPSNVLILDDPAKYTIEVGVFKTKVEVGLMPGIYTAEYKNGEGTFYHGDNPSVFLFKRIVKALRRCLMVGHGSQPTQKCYRGSIKLFRHLP